MSKKKIALDLYYIILFKSKTGKDIVSNIKDYILDIIEKYKDEKEYLEYKTKKLESEVRYLKTEIEIQKKHLEEIRTLNYKHIKGECTNEIHL